MKARTAQLESENALRVSGLRKEFSGVPVLRGVDLEIGPGQIHALLGENGSGKSTLIKILAGYHEPSGGEILVNGQPVEPGSPDAAFRAGFRFVHQDLALISSMTVQDNICFNGSFPTSLGTISRQKCTDRAAAALARSGFAIDPTARIETLSPAQRTGVAVARALDERPEGRTSVLVLDEPTANLPGHEVDLLLAAVRRVADLGVAVLYVTHRLDEVFGFADTVTVLRDGRRVKTQPAQALTRAELIHQLVGDELDQAERVASELAPAGPAVLSVEHLSDQLLSDVSFVVPAGQVIGIAGIIGSGRERILPAIFGATARKGVVRVDAQAIPAGRPDKAIGAGVAYLPPDRKTQGGFMDLSCRENISVVALDQFWNRLRLNRGKERRHASEWFTRLGVRPSGAHDKPLWTLSGGNQQKVLFAKWLQHSPRVLLLDEPTQGVDVGAKAVLHAQLLDAASHGVSVVVSSSDVEELTAICREVLVMREGRMAARLDHTELTPQRISKLCLTDSNSLTGVSPS